jgi:threonine/homoserine/homoserine lactone efflux protein
MDLLLFYGMVAAISLSGVMSPGPITAITLARGRRDPLAGLWINCGHAIVETPLIIALLAGLGPYLASPGLWRATSLAGGLILLWLGARLIRRDPGGPPPGGPPPGEPAPGEPGEAKENQRGPILEGVVMTALNPYWLIWWLTVGAGLIARARAYPAGWIVAGMIALHLACDFAWGTFLSWAAWRGGGGFGEKGWRRIEAGCGTALAGFGLYFLWDGVSKI